MSVQSNSEPLMDLNDLCLLECIGYTFSEEDWPEILFQGCCNVVAAP